MSSIACSETKNQVDSRYLNEERKDNKGQQDFSKASAVVEKIVT